MDGTELNPLETQQKIQVTFSCLKKYLKNSENLIYSTSGIKTINQVFRKQYGWIPTQNLAVK